MDKLLSTLLTPNKEEGVTNLLDVLKIGGLQDVSQQLQSMKITPEDLEDMNPSHIRSWCRKIKEAESSMIKQESSAKVVEVEVLVEKVSEVKPQKEQTHKVCEKKEENNSDQHWPCHPYSHPKFPINKQIIIGPKPPHLKDAQEPLPLPKQVNAVEQVLCGHRSKARCSRAVGICGACQEQMGRHLEEIWRVSPCQGCPVAGFKK